MKRWIRFCIYRVLRFIDSTAVGIIPWTFLFLSVFLGSTLGRLFAAWHLQNRPFTHGFSFFAFMALPFLLGVAVYVYETHYVHWKGWYHPLHHVLAILFTLLLYYMSISSNQNANELLTLYFAIILFISGWINRRYYYRKRYLTELEHTFAGKDAVVPDEWRFW